LILGPCLSAAQLVTQQVKGIVGESLTFPVEIPNLKPDTEINWRYGFKELDFQIARIQNRTIKVFEERFKARLQLDNMSSSLRINGLEREDSGIYQVETIGGNRFIKRFHLSVYKSRLVKFILILFFLGHCLSESWSGVQQVKGIVGESLTFPVEIPNLPLDTEINWRYGPVGPDWPIARIQNGKIDAGFEERFTGRLQRDNFTNSLRITNLEREDSGFYQIEITGEVRLKRSMRLSVYDPVPEPEVNGSVVLANRSCTLLCFVGNTSEVNVSWMRDGKPLHTTELEISQEMQGDNVTYTCVASNPASNKTTTVTPSHYC
ncbi:hypothetical protein HHUSO_G36715, partial [Huso huso]